MSGCSLMLCIRLHLRLLGAVCCFDSAAPVRVGCFLPLPGAWGLVRVLALCAVGLRSWAGSPSWSVLFGVSCCCLRSYTYSPYCVSLKQYNLQPKKRNRTRGLLYYARSLKPSLPLSMTFHLCNHSTKTALPHLLPLASTDSSNCLK